MKFLKFWSDTYQAKLSLPAAVKLATETFIAIEDSVDEVDRFTINPSTLEKSRSWTKQEIGANLLACPLRI